MQHLKKVVQFDHLRPYYRKVDEKGASTEHRYDLSNLFKYISDNPLINTAKTIYGDTHLFHICKYRGKDKIWEIQVLHLREKILPGIADDKGAYELIQLENNEYPAESTTMMYDETKNILYLQRNIFGTSIKAMEIFLQMLSPEGTQVVLKPISVASSINKVTPSKLYRRVILVADSEQLDEEYQDKSLGKIINSFGKYKGKIIEINLGMGYSRGSYLNPKETSELINEAYTFPGTQKLKVSSSDPTDVHFETIDLLDDRSVYKIEFDYSREKPISHARLFVACLAEYKKRYTDERVTL